uniref:Predicted protein n=1 Tax=Hordeum vulgare subsp. vulgare TaxID=112509 RepID=F2D0V4_HORVV|nr:predicted protein [Hordeum vulgare subsp. vulgare]
MAAPASPFRAYPATSAFQATRSRTGIRSNTLRASPGRRHLAYMLASAVAARDSAESPRAASCAWTARPVARSARAAQSLRREVKVRRTGLADAEVDMAAKAASAPGRSERAAADLSLAWWSVAACPPAGGGGDEAEHSMSSCILFLFSRSYPVTTSQ